MTRTNDQLEGLRVAIADMYCSGLDQPIVLNWFVTIAKEDHFAF
jgi:hypothetical protein